MKKIVLVDDDADIRTLIELIVNSMNLSFGSINFINDIVTQISSENPDLILMDLRIPEIGGFEAVKLLKKNQNTCTIPVLLFSASIDVVKLCKECGADGYVLKPFDIIELRNQLKKHIYNQ